MPENPAPPDDLFHEPLTDREHEILVMLAEGFKDREIAHQLHLALKTIKWYNSQIYSKLSVNNRQDAVAKAQQLGLIDQKEPYTTSNNLPAQITPFIGRDRQVAELVQLLENQEVRLITILAPGGMGKTRLSLEVGRQQLRNFRDGVFYVALAPAITYAHVVTAIADALDLRLSQDYEPVEQFKDFLRDKRLLLILDNFEHLLEAAPIIRQFLEMAPGIKVLATSREKLGLSAETVYVIGGMDYPVSASSGDVLAYETAKLFQQSAERTNSSFEVHAEDVQFLARICQLTEGMPLALELAAAWVNVLSLEEIAGEIQESADFLAVELRDVPRRQWSIWAVFESTWKRLNQDQKDAFQKLSVFRGGFSRKAIEAVTETDIHTILSLANKSLLQLEAGGRYQIHELLRQYAEQQLQTDVAEAKTTCDSHCAYFAKFLQERQLEIYGGEQRRVAIEIEAELENIRVMWDWAIENTRIDDIQKSLHTFIYFCHQQSRFQEAKNILERLAESLAAETDQNEHLRFALAEVLGHLGHFYLRLGLFEKSRATLEETQAIYTSLNRRPTQSVAIVPEAILGLLANVQGDYETATRSLETSLREAQATGNSVHARVCSYFLIGVYFAQGEYETARQFGQQAYALVQSQGDRWFSAYILIELGKVARALGDYDEAKHRFRDGYSIRKEFDDPAGMAEALNHLGSVLILEGNYTEAQEIYQQTIAIYDKVGDRGGRAVALNGMGKVTLALGDTSGAEYYFYEALRVAGTQIVHITFSILTDIGALLLQTGNLERGTELLALTLHHSSANREIKTRAEEILRQHEDHYPNELFTPAIKRGEMLDLEGVVFELLDD